MNDFHEPENLLSVHARDLHRALVSLKEEVEAIDWYNQRWEACCDEELRAVLAHNRDEEIEHAVMTLEWLRRNMPQWGKVLRAYLFTEGPIAAIEAGGGWVPPESNELPPQQGASGDLRIGSQRRRA